ncbi:hypothetical protein VRU48_19130 [Pedobacter sp. KR3-3]|uniref:Uncharacterized protein n=1 Tax=Pedobacter albus TaxID=3113905 RepID=A0ABU7ICQ6_9SPHI|nr:hypothetical protein [Pedobacter sp. KR3-3]MEE1947248.1 hypothetical protein [Pedobacter sp. KR3-3]
MMIDPELILFLDQKKQIENSDGYRHFRKLLKLRFSYLTFLDNSIELKRTFRRFASEHEDFFYTPAKLNKRQRTIVRQLYNAISSAQNLKEHLRKENPSFSQSPGDSDLLYFFRELRNMLVHHHSFSLVSRRVGSTQAGQRSLEVFQSMDLKPFVDYLNERKKAKSISVKMVAQINDLLVFIDTLPTGFSFEKVFSSYCQSILCFYRYWQNSYILSNYPALADLYENPLLYKGKVAPEPVSPLHRRYLGLLLRHGKPEAET